jgi:hypothetical protein
MMKLNQSMNSNYGSVGDGTPLTGGSQQHQILIKKQKKGAGRKTTKTPLDFESSMSSNSALLVMDGGTGSEGINNFK